jgi:hypothetical protein
LGCFSAAAAAPQWALEVPRAAIAHTAHKHCMADAGILIGPGLSQLSPLFGMVG